MAKLQKVPPFPRNTPVINESGYPTEAFNTWVDAVEARIGGILGVLPDELVSEAALADGSVSTNKIELSAVTESSVDFPGNVDITNTNSWTTISSVSHDASGTAAVIVLFAAYYRIDNRSGGTHKVLWGRLVRDSTVVSANNSLVNAGAGGWAVGNFPYFFNDNPSAGTYTYKFQVITTENNETGPFDESSLTSPTTWPSTSQASDATFRVAEWKR